MFNLMEWLTKQEVGFRLQKTNEGVWQAVGGRGVIYGEDKELPDCLMKAVTKQGGTWEADTTEAEDEDNEQSESVPIVLKRRFATDAESEAFMQEVIGNYE